MAGGSFGGIPPGSGPNAMQQSLFSQMDSMRRTSVGIQDIFANQMMGASPYGMGMGGQGGMGMVGDTMYRLNQNLEKMTQAFTQSSTMTGNRMFGGAGVSGGQMIAAGYFGAPVQMQGAPGGALGAQLGRMMFAENVELGMERMERAAVTQMLPSAIGAAASLLPGGALLGPLAGAAAQAYAPMGLRALGLDASLQRGQMARQFRMDIGERMAGGSVAGRFAASYQAGNRLAGGMAEYINQQQEMYAGGPGGLLNFGLSAEEYAPLQQAMTSTMNQRDLNRLVEGGAGVIKEQMDALLSVSATLNMTFKETADLARQFGEVEGGTTALHQYATTIEDAAQRAGGGLRRGMATQFGLAMRTQARQLGLQGELVAGQTVQDVGILQRAMNQTAGQRMLTHDQLAAFGGATEQERIQNMVQTMFNAGAMISQGPMGGIIRGNVLAGRRYAMEGGIMNAMGAAGAQFARDPFGFVISQADPRVNQQVQNQALFSHMQALEETFGQLDPQAASAAFISRARELGMSQVQAGAVLSFYQRQRDTAAEIAQSNPGASISRVMGAAQGLASTLGISPHEAMARLKGGMSLSQAEGLASGTFGFGAAGPQQIRIGGETVDVSKLSDAKIDQYVREAGDRAAEAAEKQVSGRLSRQANKTSEAWWESAEDAQIEGFGAEQLKAMLRSFTGLVGTGFDIVKNQFIAGPEVNAARTKAMAEMRARLQRARTRAVSTQAEAAFVGQHAAFLRRAGVSVSEAGTLGSNAFANVNLEAIGGSGALGTLVRSIAGGGDITEAQIDLLRKDESTFQGMLRTLGALSHQVDKTALDKRPELARILADKEIDDTEAKSSNIKKIIEFLSTNVGGGGGKLATSLTLNALRPMLTEANVMTSLMQSQTDYLRKIAENTTRAGVGNDKGAADVVGVGGG